MRITADDSAPISVVGLHGELDIATADPVRRVLYDRTRGRPGRLVVDLGGVTFCGCAGLDVLLTFQREIADPGQTVFAACGPVIRRVMDMTGVRELFDLADTVDEAMTYLQGIALYC